MSAPLQLHGDLAGRVLVLASSSRYRRAVLARLRLPFEVAAPEVDESPRPGEHPVVRAERLALEKARAIAQRRREALVIGSDQVASLDDELLDKPGGFANAVAQLRRARGREVRFVTAVALVDAASGITSARVIPFRVKFRDASDAEIERYVRAEEPYDCAGSAKAEALGITLIERMTGDDPTALIGLPLIALCDLLRQRGIALP
jgi:septum formation protein